MPDYTVHDITHLDALWEMADLIAGDDYELTPTEAFVLGSAMLIHDLAMGLAAYPTGMEQLLGHERWKDTVYAHLEAELGRPPNDAELDIPSEAIITASKRELLRDLHAEQAARLPHERFRDRASDAEYYLIADADLRNMYGELIGRIAASHWWDHRELTAEFNAIFGAPASLPKEWTVDPLKCACLLRTADASHIDSRRAPGLLRAIRKIDDASRIHWVFQEHMQRPWLDGDRLTYTATRPFDADDAAAWWLCVDTLRMIDRELRFVDNVLADTRRARFAAKSVASVEDLDRLSQLIPVRDWYPIDATIKVSDAVRLVRSLGGEQLYGKDPHVPLRELISNGADAVRARRLLVGTQEQAELRFRVHVEIRYSTDKCWLVVQDNGVGMSPEVMGGALLDFGKSYWMSPAARRDFPGLISSGFAPSGEFGIGFFSIFMLGQHVLVRSRRFDRALTDTHVLEFSGGLGSRPVLRKAQDNLLYGGTEVLVEMESGVCHSLLDDHDNSLAKLCAWLCPALDVDLDVTERDGTLVRAVTATDWRHCEPTTLLSRLGGKPGSSSLSSAARIRPVIDEAGQVVARAAISAISSRAGTRSMSTVTVKGMRSSSILSQVAGLFLGRVLRAGRDVAMPIASGPSVAKWATEQAVLLAQDSIEQRLELECADVVLALGGDPAPLVVAQAHEGFLRPVEVMAWAKDKDRIRLIQDAAFSLALGDEPPPHDNLSGDVLVISMGYPVIWQTPWVHGEHYLQWPDASQETMQSYCARLIAEAWETQEPYLFEQLEEHLQIVQAYEREHEHVRDDPNFPFQEQVGRLASGKPFITVATTLVRPQDDTARSSGRVNSEG